MKYSEKAKEILEQYFALKMIEMGEGESIFTEVREDLSMHIDQTLMDKNVEVVTDFELKKVLAEMGELEALQKIEAVLAQKAEGKSGFIREDDFSIRHRKIIMSTGLVLLCFFFFKFLVFDGFNVPNGTTFKEVGPNTYKYEKNPLQINIADDPEMSEFVNSSQTMKLILMIGLSLGVSFWFWMLVECLAGEKYPKKGVFFPKSEYDRWVWLLAFIFLNVIGALVYKIVVSRKLKVEVNV